jgi:dihydroxy-acid dehydratase
VEIEEVYKAVGAVATGTMTLEQLEDWTRVAVQGPGVCAGLATANSMHMMAEALGMTMPGTTPIRAGSERLFEAARRAGRRILTLIDHDILPRRILTCEAFANAIRVALAIGASVNLLCPEAYAVNCSTVSTIVAEPFDIDEQIVRPIDDPVNPDPGLIVLRGNIASEGAIVKLSAVPPGVEHFNGPARIFEDEDVAIRHLADGAISPGDVVILRMMGPIGGPGTVFACSFMAAAAGAGLAESIAVVTDGELSGLNRGITIGQVMPEAATGGPLAVVRENEPISIDFRSRTIQLDVEAAELKTRLEAWRPPARNVKAGWLAIYSQVVQPLSKGAVLGPRILRS